MADSGDFLDTLRDNVWVPVLVAIFVVVIILAVTICFIYKCRRRRRYDYSALEEDMQLAEKMDLEKRIEREAMRDAAYLTCQFYLRCNPRYTLLSHQDEIGSRICKSWFMVEDKEGKGVKLMSIFPKNPTMTIPFNNVIRKSLNDLLTAVKHPYVYPFDNIDFLLESEQIVTVQAYNAKGSLKDLIYHSRCLDEWGTKYGFMSTGLPVHQIQTYGKQILQALAFFAFRGFPSPYGHLHSGNVILEGNICRLTGHEMSFLGYQSRVASLVQRKVGETQSGLDSLCFGHLVYEMLTGFECQTAHPSQKILRAYHDNPVVELLDFIFTKSEDGDYPSVNEIQSHKFFESVKLDELTHRLKSVRMTSDMKALLKLARKGKRSEIKNSNAKWRRRGESVTEYTTKTETSSTGTARRGRRTVPRTPPPRSKPPSAPPLPPTLGPVLPTGAAQGIEMPDQIVPPANKSALLGQIRKGTQLKKTKTVDKSAPRI